MTNDNLKAREVMIKNMSGETIPARSFARITSLVGPLNNSIIDGVAQVSKPNADSMAANQLVITGPISIPPNGTSQAFPATAGMLWVNHNGTDPVNSDVFGSVQNQWYGEKDKSGFQAHGSGDDFAMISPDRTDYMTATGEGGCDAEDVGAVNLRDLRYIWTAGACDMDRILLLEFPPFHYIPGRAQDNGWLLMMYTNDWETTCRSTLWLAAKDDRTRRWQYFNVEIEVILEEFDAATTDYDDYDALDKSAATEVTFGIRADSWHTDASGSSRARWSVGDHRQVWYGWELPYWVGPGYGVALRIGGFWPALDYDDALDTEIDEFHVCFASHFGQQYGKLLRIPWASL